MGSLVDLAGNLGFKMLSPVSSLLAHTQPT